MRQSYNRKAFRVTVALYGAAVIVAVVSMVRNGYSAVSVLLTAGLVLCLAAYLVYYRMSSRRPPEDDAD